MENPLFYFNIITDCYGIVFCIIGVVVVLLWGSMIGQIRISAAIAFVMNITAIAANFAVIFLTGRKEVFVLPLLIIFEFAEYAAWYFMSFVFCQYVIDRVGYLGHDTRFKWAVWGYNMLMIVLLVVAQFNGMYYFFDRNNIYHRGELYPLSQAVSVVALFISVIILLCHRKKFPISEFIIYLLLVALSNTAILLQIFIEGIPFMLIALTFAMIILFITLLLLQVRYKNKSDRDLAAMKLLLAESQIQPHFLYNSLVAIKQLCKDNPPAAAEAIDDFSFYLRGNMDALSTDHCIPIETELKHVDHYFALEKKRFGNKVNLILELNDTDFELPPLTVQPLVENAVKYGVMQKLDGVCVKIKTYSNNLGNYVEISDNGNGFDTESYKTDGEKHLGLSMVGERLKTMAHGTLDVKSTPGEGSVITVFVPKKSGD